MSTPTIIIFGDPTYTDWRLTRLKMETSVPLRQAIDEGKLNILFIIPDQVENWETITADYPEKWMVGIAPGINEMIDLRINPSAYYIGSDGKIILKNTTVEDAVNQALTRIYE